MALWTKEIGRVKVDELDALTVQAALRRLSIGTDGLSKASLVKLRSTLRQALEWDGRRRQYSFNAAAAPSTPSQRPFQ